MKIIKFNCLLIIFVFLSILLISNDKNFNQINGQYGNELPAPAQSKFNEGSLAVNHNFSLIETTEDSGTQENVSSVDINLDNSRWNITNLKLNITNKSFQKEIKTIADEEFSSYQINYVLTRLGLQLQINYNTTLYGLYIYGQNASNNGVPSANVYLRICGSYQNGTPDETKEYLPQMFLNMTKSQGKTWHLQKFQSNISLKKGTYYIIINGSAIVNKQTRYNWWHRDYDLNNPTLNTSQYSQSEGWSLCDTGMGFPFLCKLIQFVNGTYYPTEINMTANISGIIYPIEDVIDIKDSGRLNQNFYMLFPNVSSLTILIKNNASDSLIFNVSYYIKLNHSLSSNGLVQIRDNLENQWTIEPILQRFGWNYSVSYKYPKSWENFEVFRNSAKLTMGYTINPTTQTLIILNNSIPSPVPYVPWEIKATSTNFDIALSFLSLEFELGKDLRFNVTSPVKFGNYTFIMSDTLEFEYIAPTKNVTSPDTFSFNYTLPNYAYSNEWIVYVFWYNNTDAGVKTQMVHMLGSIITKQALIPSTPDEGGNGKTEVTGLDPFLVFITILIIGIVAASSFTSYATLKRIKNTRDTRRKKLSDKITNVFSLSHVIVIDKNSGLNVYEEFYGGRNLDTTLVSGFLDAIRSFGIELTSARTQSQAISLEYQDSKILMAEFKSFRLILIMGEKASEEFLKSITNLSYDIDNNFGEELRNFNGDVSKFREIRNLIETHLNTAFICPLKVVEPKDIELKKPLERLMIFKEKKFVSERAMILKAKKFMKENNLNYFFTSFLLSEQNLTPKEIETISKLLEKKIFQPIELTSQIK